MTGRQVRFAARRAVINAVAVVRGARSARGLGLRLPCVRSLPRRNTNAPRPPSWKQQTHRHRRVHGLPGGPCAPVTTPPSCRTPGGGKRRPDTGDAHPGEPPRVTAHALAPLPRLSARHRPALCRVLLACSASPHACVHRDARQRGRKVDTRTGSQNRRLDRTPRPTTLGAAEQPARRKCGDGRHLGQKTGRDGPRFRPSSTGRRVRRDARGWRAPIRASRQRLVVPRPLAIP